MRTAIVVAITGSLLAGTAARADDACSPPRLIDSIQMTRVANPHPINSTEPYELVPVMLNGIKKNFLLETGLSTSTVKRPTAEELMLPLSQGGIGIVVNGKIQTSEQALVQEFVMGHVRAKNHYFPVAPSASPEIDDGEFGLDLLSYFDVDVDFGTDLMKFFAVDHCPGSPLGGPNIAVLPFRPEHQLFVSVTLDGHEMRAMISSSSPLTSVRLDIAERLYGLTMGSADTPLKPTDLDPNSMPPAYYSHVFKTLSFGSVSIDDPSLLIVPTGLSRDTDRRELVGDRTKTERDLVNAPEMFLGMDMLRQLHLYVSYKEGKIYFTKTSGPDQVQLAQPQ